LLVGRHSKVSPRSVRQGVALIGSNCHIDASAAFHGEVVVSDNVLIDRDAEIRDSVILPNTYVGQLVDIRNAIVRGGDLIRVDTGAHLHVNDTFLIADLAVSGTTEYLTRPLNRLLALLLLAISAPLWVIAALLAMLVSPKNPISRQRLRGNRIELNEFGIRQRRAFSAWVWQCPPPVLRYLPRILAVVTGDLNLVGTVPITEETAAERLEEWQREADRAPSGLIGPSQLLLPRQAVEEDVILSDALYARQRNIGKDLYYLGLGLRKFFSRDAWLG
jgi:lipopolysaccharide/colanic/teichoic acid biosynthesis glycosyltransferase